MTFMFSFLIPRSEVVDMCSSSPRNVQLDVLTGLPDIVQSTDYSCGPACLQAVLSYYGEEICEKELMERMRTAPHNGTDPEDIVRVARELGFNAAMRTDLEIGDLAASVRIGAPVIIAAQAWAGESPPSAPWADEWEHGHYMVVIGVHDGLVYLEDPATKEHIGVLPVEELNDRWHNYIGESHDHPQAERVRGLGIFITKR